MSFYDWLILKYRKKNGEWKDNRFGDLAKDAAGDRCFPRRETNKDKILGHLRWDHYACHEAIECCEEAFSKYKRYMSRNA